MLKAVHILGEEPPPSRMSHSGWPSSSIRSPGRARRKHRHPRRNDTAPASPLDQTKT